MSVSHRIEYVDGVSDRRPQDCVRFVGGRNPGGGSWRITQAAAVSGIEDGRWSFYVVRPSGERVDVVVATSPFGEKYLKTCADRDHPKVLLGLPPCP